MQPITIGKLSALTDCHIETIRYYERIGLLPEPERSAGGQRQYLNEDVKRLAFVRRTRELGFSIAEVQDLLGYIDQGDYTCADVRAITREHLAAVRSKLKDLRRLERTLKKMLLQCDGGGATDCPILDELYQ